MTTRFCTNCGAERAEGAAFCTSCGAPFAPAAAAQPAAQPPPAEAPAPPAQPEPQPPYAHDEPVPPTGSPPQWQQAAHGQPEPVRWPLLIGGVLGFVALIAAAMAMGGAFGGSRQSGAPTSPAATAPGAMSATPAPRPMTMPSNARYFFGTWGPNCPGSTADAITFHSDGTLQAPGGPGTWTIDAGSTITMTGNGRTVTSEWNFSSYDAAVAYGMGPPGGQPVRRCS